jgi:phospholipid/cholesterol/gamma-HCH transport system permease protein
MMGSRMETPPPLTTHESMLVKLGRLVIDGTEGARALTSLFLRTLWFTFKGSRPKGSTAQQAFEIGNNSASFLALTMGFIGMILVYQSAVQLGRLVPDYSMVGANYGELLVRELGPTIGALMLATRVGAGMAAEIASMVVTEQVDALRLCAADPVDFLVVPRFLASLVMTLVVVVLSSAMAYATGAITAFIAFDVRFDVFANLSLVDFGDVATGLTKSIAYGAAIPICSCHCGLEAHGGSAGVGRATTAAVVLSSLAIIVLNFFISAGAFLVGL